MIWHDGCSFLGFKFMPLTLTHPATTGGLAAALVSTLFHQDFTSGTCRFATF